MVGAEHSTTRSRCRGVTAQKQTVRVEADSAAEITIKISVRPLEARLTVDKREMQNGLFDTAIFTTRQGPVDMLPAESFYRRAVEILFDGTDPGAAVIQQEIEDRGWQVVRDMDEDKQYVSRIHIGEPIDEGHDG